MAKTEKQATVRLAAARDVHVIADMSRRLIEQGLPWRWRSARIYQHVRHPESTVIVAEQDGLLAGFAVASFGESTLHLNLLAVSENFRQQGIGALLVDWLKESAAIAGIASINLEVRRSNEGAIRFYDKLGFETVGMHRGYYEGKDDARLMSLRLISQSMEEKRPR